MTRQLPCATLLALAFTAGCDCDSRSATPGPTTSATVGETPPPLPSDQPPKDSTIHSDEDCRRAPVCRDWGACTAFQGRCKATKDEDCAASTWCKRGDRCVARDGLCREGSEKDKDCDRPRGTDRVNPCRRTGACTAQNGICTVTSTEDCRKSLRCQKGGFCSFIEGSCLIASAADCQGADICKLGGRCRYEAALRGKGGRCVDETKGHEGHRH